MEMEEVAHRWGIVNGAHERLNQITSKKILANNNYTKSSTKLLTSVMYMAIEGYQLMDHPC